MAIKRTYDLRKANYTSFQEEAFKLTKILRQRYRLHLEKRVEDVSKHSHWCLLWAVKNLPRAAALMIINGHVTDDLECFTDDSTCLLQNPLLKDSAFVEVDMADCCEEGCYLYFDTKNSCWVRSGKAVGRKFTERHKEHAQKAILEDAADLSLRFYRTYPS
jgi:hypothetical protein